MVDVQFSLIEFLYAGLSLGGVGLLTILGQFLYQTNYIDGEYARKFIHMLSALWIASWRFFLPWELVNLMAALLGIGVIIARRLSLLDAVFKVDRPTKGEISYAVAIGLSAIFFRAPELFALCIINLGFADGLAAIVGTKYGSGKHKVLGMTKSYSGSFACFVFAVASGLGFYIFATDTNVLQLGVALHVLAAAAAITAAELVGYKGFDNISIPVITGILYMSVVV